MSPIARTPRLQAPRGATGALHGVLEIIPAEDYDGDLRVIHSGTPCVVKSWFVGSSGAVNIQRRLSMILSVGQSHHLNLRSFRIVDSSNLFRTGRAGFPGTIVYGATSAVTTALASMAAPSPIVTPDRTTAPLPIQMSLPMVTSPFEAGWPCMPTASGHCSGSIMNG